MEEAPPVSDHSLWVERFRPKKLEDVIGNANLKETVRLWIEHKDIPHILFFSCPGTGKTSIAKILIDLIPCDSLMINASDENGVNDIRNKVQDFCMTMGVQPLKIMFLDECLDENTIVWVLRDGGVIKLPIKELLPDTDLVKSLNIKSEKIEWMPFVLIDKGIREVYSMQLSNGETIICTGTHKWYVKDLDGSVVKMTVDDIMKNNISEIISF